jgi:hypothetical protein
VGEDAFFPVANDVIGVML